MTRPQGDPIERIAKFLRAMKFTKSYGQSPQHLAKDRLLKLGSAISAVTTKSTGTTTENESCAAPSE